MIIYGRIVFSNIHNGSQMTLKVKWKLLNIDVIFEHPEIQKSKMENPETQRQIAEDKFNLTVCPVLTWAACGECARTVRSRVQS